MKITVLLSAALTAMLVFPVLLCSCGSDGATTSSGAEAGVPQQEVKSEAKPVEVKAEPKAAEVQPVPKLDNGSAEEKTAGTEKKAAPAPAPAPAPAAAEPQVKLPCEHVVHTGDSLWRIAQKYYGRGSLWKQIYEANKAEIKNKDILEPGTVLKIPAVK